MKKSGFTSFVVVMVAIVLMISGCAQSKTEQQQNSSGEGVKEDELVLAVGNEPEVGFDPTTGWGRYGSPLFQSTLFTRNAELQIENDLATGYDLSEDGKVWTVTLRDDVKFSDGTPLTAEDVVFTFQTIVTNGSVVDLQVLEKVEATDTYTVVFTLKDPQSTFVNVLTATGIVPKHVYGAEYAEKPIGSGPYRLVQWDKGQQLIVEANPKYYGDKPFFQKVVFLFLNEDAAFAAARAGDVDVAAIPAAFSKQEIPGMRLEAIKTVDNRGIVFPFVKSGTKTDDGLLIGNDVTADISIRKAINIAIDRQALIDGVLEGYGSPAYTSVDGLPWWNPETTFEDANVDEASRILEAAGWKDTDNDSVLEKGSLKAEFTLYYPANDVIRQSLSIAVADMLKPIGVKVTIEGEAWEKIEQVMHSNPVMMGWGSHDPLELYNLYSSNYAGVEYYNNGFYKNETVDAYLEEALYATNEDEANEFWQKAQYDGTTGLSAKGDAPWAWLVNIDHLYLVNDKLDIGDQKIQPHEHGWPITDNLVDWKWNE